MATNINLPQYKIGSAYNGLNVPMPDEFLFPAGFTVPSRVPLQLIAPIIALDTPTATHYRCGYPGMDYEAPMGLLGGNLPYQYKIDPMIPGRTIGSGLVENEFGDLTPDQNSGNVRIVNPPAGLQQFTTTAFSQDAQIVALWKVNFSTENHFFTAPTSRGLGDGSHWTNARAWSETYRGPTTEGPAKGKVLVMMGGEYTGVDYVANAAFNPTSIISYPGETANLNFKISIVSNDSFIGCGIKIHNIFIGQQGAITIDGTRHRVTIFKVDAENLTQDGSPNNQSFIFTNLINNNFRDALFIKQCKSINSTTHLLECYNIAYGAIDACEIIFNNGATDAPRICIFPKINNKLFQVTNCKFINPGMTCTFISFGGQGNTATGQCLGIAQYNTCVSNNGIAVKTNQESGNIPKQSPSVNYIDRNSWVNSREYYYGEGMEGSWTYALNNAVQNVFSGAIPPSEIETGQYTQSGTELYGADFIFDEDYRIIDTTKLGQRSAQFWKPT